ncbi:MAG: hypothetical protein SGILL_009752 [Bacillariaceae sp.]
MLTDTSILRAEKIAGDVTSHDISETLASLLALTAVNDNNRTVLTEEILLEASSALEHFSQQPSTSTMTECTTIHASRGDIEHQLAYHAVLAARLLCQIPQSVSPSQQKKKRTWQALQAAAEKLCGGSRSQEANVLAASLVFGALALLLHSAQVGGTSRISRQDDGSNGTDAADSAKASASALSSTIRRNKPLRLAGRFIATNILRTFLVHAAHSDTFDLGLLNHFATGFKLGGGKEIFIEPHITANAVRNALRMNQHMVTEENECNLYNKKKVSGALALASQLQPWQIISPVSLVEAAIPLEYWHAAEEICRSAHRTVNSAANMHVEKEEFCFSPSEQKENTKRAVESLVDSAMEGRMYRRADSLATSLYEAGGRSRYVEARFNHACETICKVISRKQIPIIDRQIERVDKAVAKVQQDANLYDNSTQSTIDSDDTSQVPPFDPSSEIRRFAIEQLEEAGDLASAKRLTGLFGFDDSVYDERAIMLAAAMRRRRYLQYDDVLSHPIPALITTAKELSDSFRKLRGNPYGSGPYGLDAEWDEETIGAAVLQLANPTMALLIDIPALLGTQEGVKAMEETVGKLLACKDSVVLGFACRQDLSRLRASPFVGSKGNRAHWLSDTRAVMDVQTLVGDAESKLEKAGLARVCQHYFQKPLDKAEQCSLWSARPLSEHQRCYAALDAWICVAIYLKLGVSGNEEDRKG